MSVGHVIATPLSSYDVVACTEMYKQSLGGELTVNSDTQLLFPIPNRLTNQLLTCVPLRSSRKALESVYKAGRSETGVADNIESIQDWIGLEDERIFIEQSERTIDLLLI